MAGMMNRVILGVRSAFPKRRQGPAVTPAPSRTPGLRPRRHRPQPRRNPYAVASSPAMTGMPGCLRRDRACADHGHRGGAGLSAHDPLLPSRSQGVVLGERIARMARSIVGRGHLGRSSRPSPVPLTRGKPQCPQPPVLQQSDPDRVLQPDMKSFAETALPPPRSKVTTRKRD